jgi:hypothetical protein
VRRRPERELCRGARGALCGLRQEERLCSLALTDVALRPAAMSYVCQSVPLTSTRSAARGQASSQLRRCIIYFQDRYSVRDYREESVVGGDVSADVSVLRGIWIQVSCSGRLAESEALRRACRHSRADARGCRASG